MVVREVLVSTVLCVSGTSTGGSTSMSVPPANARIAQVDTQTDSVESGADTDVVRSPAQSISPLARSVLVTLAVTPGSFASDIATGMDRPLMDIVDAVQELMRAGLVHRAS